MNKKEAKAKPKYGAFSNIAFTMKNIVRIDKTLLLSMILLVFCMVAQPVVGVFMPKYIIQFFEQVRSVTAFLLLVAIFGAVSLVLGQMRSFADGYFPRMKSMYRSMRLGSEMCLASMQVDYKYLSSEAGQLENQKAQRAIGSTTTGVEDIVTRIVECSANLLGAVVYIFLLSSLNPLVILGLAVCGAISFFAGNLVNRYRVKHMDEVQKCNQRVYYLTTATTDVLYAKDIRMYGMYDWLSALLRNGFNQNFDWDRKFALRMFLSEVTDGLIAFLRDGFAYLYLISLVLAGTIPVSEFILYISAIAGLSMWVSGFAKNAILLNTASIQVSDFRVFLDQADENQRQTCPKRDFSLPMQIEFRHVNFAYGEHVIFQDFNLVIEKGKKVALVGINGAGKTTLVKLLLNLITPDSGEILLDGVDSRQVDLKQYFSQFSVAFQDALILAYGMDVNISMRNSKETDQDRVDQAIETAGLTEKVKNLKKGKYTSCEKYLDSEGTELSGGERQKVILARALYKAAPVLVLDEPSAALDPIAESRLYETYHEMTKNKTSIYISHRLSSTKFCDEVLLLEGGRIAERGTHSELTRLGGTYAHMFDVQSHYYRQEEGGEPV
ncbi:MAG: ABC transporter ATP-binding protein [Christensenella sp.]|nr:ABC transporter ATP-binding protein [Christensenella sp.]